MSYFKNICCGIICLCYGHLLKAQDNSSEKKSPFTIRGNVGASANFYSSNEVIYTRPSSAYNVYGSFMAKINKVELPFSFVINQYSKSKESPYIQMGISPTYKWAKLHLGYRNIPFSPLTFDGQSFKGVGLELNPEFFRFAAFYGRLNKAVNEDTASGYFRLPQYSRTGYGVKMGIGNSSRFIDLFYFHAKDDSSSASFINNSVKNSIRAQENTVLGTSFKLTMLKKITWRGDVAISGLIQDLSSNKTKIDASNESLEKFIGKFLPSDAGILAGYSGQSSLAFYTKSFNTDLSFRRVQPGFKSLGTPYLLNDIELINLNNSLSVVKGKLNISTNLSQQHNNLDKNLSSELRTRVGNININTILSQRLSLNLNYSGYNLKQKNGNAQLPDSLRLNDSILLKQRISQFNISPSYYITKGNKLHFINGNVSLQNLKDKNPATAARSNSNNISASVSYTLSLINKALNFSVNYLFSRYRQDTNSNTSNGVTLGASAQLLKNKSLNVQGNIGYYLNKYSNISAQNNMSYSFSAGYHAKRHAFNLFANYIYTQPNNAIINAINKTFPYAVATKNLASGISYSYTF